MLEIDATLTTGEPGQTSPCPWTANPMWITLNSCGSKKASAETELPVIPRGTFSNTRLNLGIDVENGAQARIVFDRKVGDEIVGNATGHLDFRSMILSNWT